MRGFIFTVLLASILIARAACAETQWRIETSPKYDALCLIGSLAGDSFYTRYYETELEELRLLLSEETFSGAQRAYGAFKDGGTLAGPWLALAYSVVEGDTLDAAITATEQAEGMREELQASDYWKDETWALFEAARPDILTMLHGLRDAQFTRWWRQNAEKPSRKRANELQPRLAEADVVPMIEKSIGRRLASNRITLYAARFCRPHGIRITGERFLLDIVDTKDPLATAGATAIHEMIHPPFDDSDERVTRLIARLKRDDFVYQRWKNHDPSFGYNTFAGYVDENVTKALDQIIGESIGMTFTADPEERWLQNDKGMHVLAAAVYELMRRENFLDGHEDATTFLDRMLREGKLVPGQIAALVPETLRLSGQSADDR